MLNLGAKFSHTVSRTRLVRSNMTLTCMQQVKTHTDWLFKEATFSTSHHFAHKGLEKYTKAIIPNQECSDKEELKQKKGEKMEI